MIFVFYIVYKKIHRLEEELEALGGETTRSTIIKTPNLTPKKVFQYYFLFIFF